MKDFAEYRLDIVGYAEDLLGIHLHEGQKEILQSVFPKGVEPEEWQYRQIFLTAANRYGKSVILAVVHLWFLSYKHRLPAVFGTQDWWDARYDTVNICPLVDLAGVVKEKIAEILEDMAKEQIENPTGRKKCDDRIKLLFLKNPSPVGKSMYLHTIDESNYTGFKTKHNAVASFRTSDDSAKALQGRKKYLVTWDEFTRETDPLTKMASDIAPRTMDTRGIVFSAGTPHVETMSTAEQLWQLGNPENPDKVPGYISFNRSIRDNPAITQKMIDELTVGLPDYLKPQVLEGKFVQAEDAFFNVLKVEEARANIPNLRRRARGHTYILGWDLAVAKDGDRTISVVVDVSTNPCKVVEYLELPRGTQHPEIVREMVRQLSWYHDDKAGTNAFLVYDETGMAGKMFKAELATVYPRPRGYDFTNKIRKKLDILHSLRILLAKNLLVFPKDCTRLAYELKNYTRKDQHLETDAVMALALATYMVERTTGRLSGDAIILGSLSA